MGILLFPFRNDGVPFCGFSDFDSSDVNTKSKCLLSPSSDHNITAWIQRKNEGDDDDNDNGVESNE